MSGMDLVILLLLGWVTLCVAGMWRERQHVIRYSRRFERHEPLARRDTLEKG